MDLPSLESPGLVGKGNEFHGSAVQIPGLVVLQHGREGAPASLGKDGLFAVVLAKGMAVLSRDTLDSSMLIQIPSWNAAPAFHTPDFYHSAPIPSPGF